MKSEIAQLRAEVIRQRRILLELARALYTHTRTDLAPDAALPAMRAIVRRLESKKGLVRE